MATPSASPQPPRAVRVPVLVSATFVLALALWTWRLPHLVARLPSDDYWAIAGRLFAGSDTAWDPAVWWDLRINQHKVTLVAPLWAAVGTCWHGSNRPLAWFSLLLLAATAKLLLHLRPAAAERVPAATLGLLALLTALGPGHAYNLSFSFGGATYYSADLASLLALAAFSGALGARWRWLWVPLPLLGVLAFTSALAVFPALLAVAILDRRRAVSTWPLPLLAGLAWWLRQPAHGGLDRSLAWPGLETATHYLACFLGAGPSGAAQIAAPVGWALLLLVAGLGTVVLGGGRASPTTSFWLGAAVYAIGNGAMAALGRAATWGPEQAAAVRYVQFPRLAMLAVAMVAVELWLAGRPQPGGEAAAATGSPNAGQPGKRPFWRRIERPAGRATGRFAERFAGAALPAVAAGILAAVVAAALAGLQLRDLPLARAIAERTQRLERAEVLLRHGLWSEAMIREHVTGAPAQLLAVLPRLRELAHVPFDRPPELAPLHPSGWYAPAVLDHPQADAVFAALADPHRRAILRMLQQRELSVHEIAAAFAISRPAVSKHLRVLREAGLVRDRAEGRTHVHQLAGDTAAALLVAWGHELAKAAPAPAAAAEQRPPGSGARPRARAAAPGANQGRQAPSALASQPATRSRGPQVPAPPAPASPRPQRSWEPWR
jgi:DNA-binding transcriptional ArsR family regulator